MIEWEHLHPMRRAASAAGGKNEKAGAKTMGISHEYHSTSHRARHGGVSGKLRLAGVVLAILVLAYAITAILENGASAKDAQSEPAASGIAQDILAPLPMQGEADSSSAAQDGGTGEQAVTLENFGPAKQSAGAAGCGRCGGQGLRRQRHPSAQLRAGGPELFCGRGLSG